MKLAITRTICVLLLITGLVFQPLFFAGNPISSRIEANSDSSIPAAIPLGTSIGPDAAAGQVAGSIAYDIDANRLMMAGDRSSLEPDIVQLGMVT
ncbi:MAG: hypothetical protein NTV14_08405, partial [Coprothermobacterota bacterium]|nr:hypothetical protein [Coprothermobacterota bacterium]